MTRLNDAFSARSNWESCERTRQHNDVISETSWRAACYFQTKTNHISGSSDNVHHLDLIHSSALDTFCSKGSATDCSGIVTELAFGLRDRRQSGRTVCWNAPIPLNRHFNVLTMTDWFNIKKTNESNSAAYLFFSHLTFFFLPARVGHFIFHIWNRYW